MPVIYFSFSLGNQREGQKVRDLRARVGHLHWPFRFHRPRTARFPRGLLSLVYKHSADHLQEMQSYSSVSGGQGRLSRGSAPQEHTLLAEEDLAEEDTREGQEELGLL